MVSMNLVKCSAVSEMATVSPHKPWFTDAVCLRSAYDLCSPTFGHISKLVQALHKLRYVPKSWGAAVPFSVGGAGPTHVTKCCSVQGLPSYQVLS